MIFSLITVVNITIYSFVLHVQRNTRTTPLAKAASTYPNPRIASAQTRQKVDAICLVDLAVRPCLCLYQDLELEMVYQQ